jgi:hypothetical protein
MHCIPQNSTAGANAVDHHTGRWRNHNNSKKEKDCAEQINTGQVLAQRFGPAARKNASYIERLHKFLMQQQRIDIKPHSSCTLYLSRV